MQALQGLQGVFHSFHRLYYYCWLIYIYINYILFGADLHTAKSPVRLEVFTCSLP